MVIQKLDGVEFRLKEYRDLSWIGKYGTVFSVVDATGSGCICFGVKDAKNRYFVKIAGVGTVEAEIEPEESVKLLKSAVRMYRILRHPNLIRLIEDYQYQDCYVAVFEWAEGECLFDHWNFEQYAGESQRKSPMERFKALPAQKKLAVVNGIFSFLENTARKGYTAVDFYDGSLIYDFKEDKLMICDIDLFRKQPAMNDMGEDFWGTRRLKAPEEYICGACIDETTNVFTVGALIFDFFGAYEQSEIEDRYLLKRVVPCTLDRWELNEAGYQAALRAISPRRSQRWRTIHEFRDAFLAAVTG